MVSIIPLQLSNALRLGATDYLVLGALALFLVADASDFDGFDRLTIDLPDGASSDWREAAHQDAFDRYAQTRQPAIAPHLRGVVR